MLIDDQMALPKETEQTIVRLVKAVLSVGTLVNALETVVNVAPLRDGQLVPAPKNKQTSDNELTIETLLSRIAKRIGIDKFKFWRNPTKLTTFEQVISTQLALSAEYWANLEVPLTAVSSIDKIIDQVLEHSLKYHFKCAEILSFDGATLRAYAGGGVHEGKTVVLVTACGMPVELSERWLHYLAQYYYVISWESRCLFGEMGNFDLVAHDVVAQAKDLFTVMDYFGVDCSHVMGLCGGAVIALTAASLQPERISSLSLWHGDYELGSNCPKTRHQKDLQILMSMAGNSRSQAASLQKLFAKTSILANIRADLAHLILYPYGSGELLFRYGKLNGNIMTTDIQLTLNHILQPTLVVTSEDDTTAHPQGSLFVANKLPNAIFHI